MKFAVPPRRAQAGLTSDGAVVLIIGAAVVGLVGWFRWNYNTSTEAEARHFAEQAIHRLAVAHDEAYLTRSLSAEGRANLRPVLQDEAIAGLTSLGVPREPFAIKGTMSSGSDPGRQDPLGHFNAHLIYPGITAEIYLDVVRRDGHWEIAELYYYSTNSPSPRQYPALETTSTPPA